jgi:hypothetical protein
LINLYGVYHHDEPGATAECVDLFGSPIYHQGRPLKSYLSSQTSSIRQPLTFVQVVVQSEHVRVVPGRSGALADLLLVDGNPLENIKLVEAPGKNFLVIMKDGAIYKNTLPE